MKRFLALFLALTILLSLLGCGAAPVETTMLTQDTEPATEPTEATEPAAETVPAIAITEVMPDNEFLCMGHDLDWVELYNGSESSVELQGFRLADDMMGNDFLDLSGLTIPAEGYLAVTLDGSFGLSASGETVYLLWGETVVSELTYGETQPGETYAPEGTCAWPTPGFANTEGGYYSYLESLTLPELVITEVLASNSQYLPRKLSYRESEYYDLVEVKNNSQEAISLAGYGLTDKASDPTRYSFPDVTLEPGEYYVVYCSDDASLGEDHAPFKISAQGETLYLSKDGQLIDVLAVPGDLKENESYGREGNIPVYLEYPTLGQANAVGYGTAMAGPAANLPSGLYDESVEVTLEGEGTIYYTTDGSCPTQKSKVYQEPIQITGVTTIRAFCVSQRRSSPVMNYTYVVGKDHDLPIVSVAIPEKCLTSNAIGLLRNYASKAEYEAVVTLIEDGEEKFSVPCGFRLHGNDSRKQYKKNFALRFRGEYGASKLNYKVFDDLDIETFDSLLLKGGSEDWYKAMIRDELSSAIAGSGTKLYTQATKPVVLYMGGRYFGIYYIRERYSDHYVASHLNVSPESVDIVYSSGGYAQFGDNSDFQALRNYVQTHNMRKDEHYQYLVDRIDVESLMDWYICRSFMGDTDTANIRRFRSSEYDNKWRWMYFDVDWGFDWIGDRPFSGIADKGGDYILMQAVLENDQGRDAFLKRYDYLMDTALTPERINGLIDELIGSFETELERDRKHWGVSIAEWEAEIAFIRKFINGRRSHVIRNLQSYFQMSDAEIQKYFGE